jgi:hypothetical protein
MSALIIKLDLIRRECTHIEEMHHEANALLIASPVGKKGIYHDIVVHPKKRGMHIGLNIKRGRIKLKKRAIRIQLMLKLIVLNIAWGPMIMSPWSLK